MKLIVNKISIAVILAITVINYLPIAQAKEKTVIGSGTITFTGAIVASPCQIGTYQENVQTTCWNDSGKPVTTQISLKTLKKGTQELPNNKGTQSFKWIDKAQTLGVYTLIYN
ncbi:hypothetical protein [Providencia stuartii]|uniref:hypothetical protein n=1 Tax=Providencia stuartii TaxID=588 RepID=UPI0018C83F64|nr:hypothetical protein [Providencia stuartii]MBG5918659.1 hypothetical protein [Providencia stuartii]